MDNGSISGEGTLIAFGGNGTYDDGADAISGNGTVSVKMFMHKVDAAVYQKQVLLREKQLQMG